MFVVVSKFAIILSPENTGKSNIYVYKALFMFHFFGVMSEMIFFHFQSENICVILLNIDTIGNFHEENAFLLKYLCSNPIKIKFEILHPSQRVVVKQLVS